MLPDLVPNYSVGPLIGLSVNGALALLCLAVLAAYRSYRPLKHLCAFYLCLSLYFLGFTIYGYQASPAGILAGYRLMLVSLSLLPASWIWLLLALRGQGPGSLGWSSLGLSLVLVACLLLVDHPAVLAPPLHVKESGIFHPSAWLFRPLIYTYDLGVVLASILLLGLRWWPGWRKPAFVWTMLAGLLFWFLGGLHDAASALHLHALSNNPVLWLASIWLSLCLVLAVAFHLRDLETALHAEQARFVTAFQLNPDGLALLDLEAGRFLEVNRALLGLLGRRREELLGQRPRDLGLLPPASGWEAMLDEVGGQGRAENREGRLRGRDGAVLEVLWSAGIITLGSQPGLLVVTRDVSQRKRIENELACYRLDLEDLVGERTQELSRANAELQREIAERRRTEEALRQSRANLQTLFDSLQDFLTVVDLKGRLLAVNPTVIRRLGYSAQELMGFPVLQLHPRERQEEAQAVLEGILAGRGDRCQIPLITRDGHLLPVETRITRGRWGDQEVIFGISRDTSERQRAQTVLRQLAAGVAHNFNNLLAAILGNAQAVEAGLEELPEPARQRVLPLLHNVIQSALSGRGVVQRLTAYVGGRQPAAGLAEGSDPAEVVSAALRIAQAAWRPGDGARLEITTLLEPGLDVALPRDELMEICLNLIRNALEAMPAGGRLTVTTRRQDDRVALEFADTGHGMDPETARRVFEPFFSTKGVGGQGLGLPSSRGLAQAYGGDIEVESQPGRGARLRVLLPPRGPAGAVLPAASPPPAGLPRPLRVLMVEDEALVAMGMRALLEQAGHRVMLAGRVDEAAQALGEFQPEVVVCDLGLPDGDGWEVARLAAQGQPRPVPFILLTGYNSDPRCQAPPDGVPPAWRVLYKPVERAQLLNAVAQAAA